MSGPKFSVIIPACHRMEFMELCLESLERLEYPRDGFRIAVIDCGVIDGLTPYLEHYREGTGLDLYFQRLTDLPTTSSVDPAVARIGEARNLGMRLAPAEYFIFSEDDCSFEPNWLSCIESRLEDDTGMLGGTDVLPSGMGVFAEALDCLLNSKLGSPGGRRGDGASPDSYAPIKDFIVARSRVIDIIGGFPEDVPYGAERIMAQRVRQAGYAVVFTDACPIWHRRVTTLGRFVQNNVMIACRKVRQFRAEGRFHRTAHFGLLIAVGLGALAVALAPFDPLFALIAGVGLGLYVLVDLLMGLRAVLLKRSMAVGLVHLALMPVHHTSVVLGVLQGLVSLRGREV
jgi:GT2 family glycosyltransferase